MKIKKIASLLALIMVFASFSEHETKSEINTLKDRLQIIKTQVQAGLAWYSNGKLAWDGPNGWHPNGQLAWNGQDKNGWHSNGQLAWNGKDKNGWHSNGQLAWNGQDMNGWHSNGQLAWDSKNNIGWHPNGQLAGDHIEIVSGTGFILFVDKSGIKLYVASKFTNP